jgi:predicted HNH restriction endonuclease
MALPENYHRDWQRNKATDNPEWYEERKTQRTEKRRKKKAEWVKKFGGLCEKCGLFWPDYVFEFHHLDPNIKEKNPSQIFMLSDDKIEKELSKCIMVCSNCHRIVHHEDGYVAHKKRKNYARA